MGLYTEDRLESTYRSASDQKKTRFWDPEIILDVVNPDRGSLTCVGYAPSCRRRCRNPINQYNRASAYRLLEKLSHVNVATTDIDVELYELARLTLCQRYHQDQVGSMVRQWNAKIQKAQVAAIYTRPTKTESLRVKTEATELEDILAELHFLRKYFTESKTTFFASSTAGTKYNPPFVSHYTSRLHRDEEMHRRRQEEQKQEEEREQQQRKREERRHAERVREREKRRKEEARAREAKEKEERRRHEEKQRQEQERAKEAREREERNERARKRAAKLREERERKAEEQAAKERNEWDEIWISYSKRWDEIKRNGMRGDPKPLRQIIPWPLKSGDWKDLSETAIEEFFRRALPEDADVEKRFSFLKMECLKWHTDRIPRMFGVIQDGELADRFTMVARVAIKLRAELGRQRE